MSIVRANYDHQPEPGCGSSLAPALLAESGKAAVEDLGLRAPEGRNVGRLLSADRNLSDGRGTILLPALNFLVPIGFGI
jgi:hypothetical protein